MDRSTEPAAMTPASMTPTPGRRGVRHSIKGQLWLAVASIVGLTVAAGVVGWLSYRVVGAHIQTIADTSLPSIAAAHALSEEGVSMAITAPSLAAAQTDQERLAVYADIEARSRRLAELVQGALSRGASDARAGLLAELSRTMAENLARQNDLVSRRLEISQRRVEALGRLVRIHADLMTRIGPRTDAARQRLHAAGTELIEQTGESVKLLTGETVTRLTRYIEFKADAATALGAIAGALAAVDTESLERHWQAYAGASMNIGRLADTIGRDTGESAFPDLKAQIQKLGTGPAGVFDMRRRALAAGERSSDPGAKAIFAQVAKLAKLVDETVEPETASARAAIMLGGRRLDNDTRSSVSTFLKDGVEPLVAYQSFAASINLLKGTLAEAAGVTDPARLSALQSDARGILDSARASAAAMPREDAEGVRDGLDGVLGLIDGAGAVPALRGEELRLAEEERSLLDRNRELAQRIGGTARGLAEAERQSASTAAEAARGAIASGQLWLAAIVVASVGGAVLIGWLFVGNHVALRLSLLADSMRRVASGELDVPLPPERADEIGEMSKALAVFRETTRTAEENRARIEEERRAAARERAVMLRRLAEDFEAGVRELLDSVVVGANTLRSTAEGMAGNAKRTAVQADTAASAGGQTTMDVESVSASAEELSSSINEVGRNVGEAVHAVDRAVAAAAEADQTIERLRNAAERVGEIVGMIDRIAAQTGLLALNASIEASRAGDVGRGFAVVANEVKTLASQTARATDEISAQIGTMQGIALEAATALNRIGTSIEAVNAVTEAVRTAVEEQQQATGEIARNSSRAYDGVSAVLRAISDVVDQSAETGSSSAEVLNAAERLLDNAEAMKVRVEAFVTGIRSERAA